MTMTMMMMMVTMIEALLISGYAHPSSCLSVVTRPQSKNQITEPLTYLVVDFLDPARVSFARQNIESFVVNRVRCVCVVILRET